MKEIIIEYLPCLYGMVAVAGFSVIFGLRKPKFIVCVSALSFIAWAVYLLFGFMGNGAWGQTLRSLVATIAVASLSEVFARINKAPATVFLILGILPLVPGGGIYYWMEALLDGDMDRFYYQGLKTIAIAGAIAIGCSFVSAVVRFIKKTKISMYEKQQKKLEESK